jgi:hypothetical protein
MLTCYFSVSSCWLAAGVLFCVHHFSSVHMYNSSAAQWLCTLCTTHSFSCCFLVGVFVAGTPVVRWYSTLHLTGVGSQISTHQQLLETLTHKLNTLKWPLLE